GGVLPERTQAIRAAPARDTAGRVDAGAVGGIPCQGEHLLVGLPARIDPTLHHLHLLKRRARVAVAARIAQREHGEAWAAAAAHRAELPAHGHPGLVAAPHKVAVLAPHPVQVAREDTHHATCARRGAGPPTPGAVE